MRAVGRLDVGEGRDDDAPDALDRVDRQQAPYAGRSSRRIISTSRSGRNAEPPPWRCFDQRSGASMISPRAIRAACMVSSSLSISTRSFGEIVLILPVALEKSSQV